MQSDNPVTHLAPAAAHKTPPIVVQSGPPRGISGRPCRGITANKMDFVAKRLTDAPHISTGQLTKEIVAKFGTNLSPIILADLRRRLGIGASKVRCDRAMPGMVAGAQPRPQPLPQPQPQPQPESEPETANAPNQNQTPVADALRKVVQHMRHKGIERLVLHDDGTYDRYYRQLNVFTPDA